MLQKIWAKSFMATQGHEMEHLPHRRRILIKEKEKSSLLFGGKNLFNFLAALAFLHKDDLKNRMNSSFSSDYPGAINPFLHIILVQNSKEFNKFCTPNSSDDLCLLLCVNPAPGGNSVDVWHGEERQHCGGNVLDWLSTPLRGPLQGIISWWQSSPITLLSINRSHGSKQAGGVPSGHSACQKRHQRRRGRRRGRKRVRRRGRYIHHCAKKSQLREKKQGEGLWADRAPASRNFEL